MEIVENRSGATISPGTAFVRCCAREVLVHVRSLRTVEY